MNLNALGVAFCPYSVVNLPTEKPSAKFMRHHSSVNTTTQRDHNFLKVCRHIAATSPRTDLTAAQIAEMAAASPAPSYYLTYDYARRMLSERRRGVRSVRNPMGISTSLLSGAQLTPMERRRVEISGKVRTLMARFPGLKEGEALTRVLAGPASSFFLAPESARRLYTQLRRHHTHTPLRRPLPPRSAVAP